MKRERGVVMVEYVMGAAIALVVFVVVAIVLERSARNRSEAGIRAVNDMIPCQGEIAGQGTEACY